MANIMKLTRRGRTTIPRELREKYGIKEGDHLMVSDEGGRLILRRIPKLEDLAGADASFGKVKAIKKQVDKMREKYSRR